MRSFVLLTALVASSLLLVAAQTPTCQLTNLILTDTTTNTALKFADINGNPFSPDVTEYYCSCGTNTNKVTVVVKADDIDVSYDLQFTGADGTTAQQYLAVQRASNPLTFSTGKNKVQILPSCSACTAQYTVYCTKSGGGTVVGDPQFTGLRGQDYQVHGVSGEVYNIITDEHIQMNSKFVFLDSGSCPVIDGVRAQGCWSHPGSYLGEIGIKTASGDRLRIVSGPFDQGFAAVELNGVPMKVDQTSQLPCPDGDSPGFVTLNSTYIVTVQAGNYLIEFENSDMFLNQKVHVTNWKTLNSHGLLGQTWRKKTYPNPIKHVEGAVDDYVVKGKDLFGDQFLYNLFATKVASGAKSASTTPVATPKIAEKVVLRELKGSKKRPLHSKVKPSKKTPQ